jgi:hypothetical protein
VNKVDLINGILELGGAYVQWCNVYRLLRDKHIAGVYWPATAFFAGWGLWNIYFYSTMSTPISAVCAAALTLANITWVALAIRYSRSPRV